MTARPVDVNSAPPPPLPPCVARTSGSLKHRFIVWINFHARIYDIFMRDAALPMEPVSPTNCSNSALPGPMAISFRNVIRKRGCREIESEELSFFFMAQEKILNCGQML